MDGWSGMNCTDGKVARGVGRWVAVALVALLIGAGLPSAGAAAKADPVAIVVEPVFIPLTGPLADPRAEVSGLNWHEQSLAILPQEPELFGGDDMLGFFALEKTDILAYLDGERTDPLVPRRIECYAPGLTRIIRGFDGLEAMGTIGQRCYLTVEAKTDTAMAGYLVCGHYDLAGDRVVMDTTKLTGIPLGLNIPNVAEESLIISGDRVITISEANGRNINPAPQAKVFDDDINYLGSLPFPSIEYRVTDATALDGAGRFWVINYFFPPESFKLQPAPDPEAERYGAPPDAGPQRGVERLLELQLVDDERIVRTDTPPINLALDPGGACRNWEAIVRLDDRGFLIMTDQYPGTLLAFVPWPLRDDGIEQKDDQE